MSLVAKKLDRRSFVVQLGGGGLAVAAASLVGGCTTSGHSGPMLENETLRLVFDGSSGLLTTIQNKLTQEDMQVHGDGFAVIAEEFRLTPQSSRLESLHKKSGDVVEVTYRGKEGSVVATYKLGKDNHFFEKHLVINIATPYRLKSLVVSRLSLSGPELRFVKYPHQKSVTYFGRSTKGGVFMGVELPFDESRLEVGGTVTLGYRPSLNARANEGLQSEPIYVGVYQRRSRETGQPDLPLPSESEAMVRMTSTFIGPPRHGLVPMACGWWCEMEHQTYQTEGQVEGDMRSIDFLAACGVNWVSDNHPWSGEIDKMNAMRQGDHYEPGPLVKKLLKHAQEKRVNVIFWPTMNNTDPWWKDKGQPFRSDRPDWVMFPQGTALTGKALTGLVFKEFVKGNCIANRPFFDWLMGLHLDGMRTGYFPGWIMDGDFFGGGGIVIPVNCPSEQHDHLPGDSNYACERALSRMMAMIRQDTPEAFIGPMCRPSMDLGIWSNRFADSVFTLDEFGLPEPLPGLSGQPINVVMGDKARRWSRIRVHHHFFPHYLDQPLVFAAPKSMRGPEWTSEKIDYVMLSALSSSPNQLYYLPTKAGIPERDKVEIRKWLDWGRKNIRYLQVRKDLEEWPGAGEVDGSAHITGDRGLIFLFNPNPKALPGRFRLDDESIGLTSGTHFEVRQVYPAAGTKQQWKWGDEVTWNVQPHSATVLFMTSA